MQVALRGRPKFTNFVTAKLGTINCFSVRKGTVVCLMKLKSGLNSGNAFFLISESCIFKHPIRKVAVPVVCMCDTLCH